MSENEGAVGFLKDSIAGGEHWYVALLRTMARWGQAEETIGGRRYRYLIGGEAFDWLVLAERLLDAIDGAVGEREREELLFYGHPPLEIDEEEFQALIGTPKYQAYLNYLYGVVVEEALQLAVEEEIAKERLSHVWSGGRFENNPPAFERLYGRTQFELLRQFQQERGREAADELELAELKEFTYWLFKFRVKAHAGERVASDTRKGLAALSRLRAAFRRRVAPEAAEPVERGDSAAPRRRRRTAAR